MPTIGYIGSKKRKPLGGIQNGRARTTVDRAFNGHRVHQIEDHGVIVHEGLSHRSIETTGLTETCCCCSNTASIHYGPRPECHSSLIDEVHIALNRIERAKNLCSAHAASDLIEYRISICPVEVHRLARSDVH